MVYKSKIPTIDEPKTGVLQFLFENKYNMPEDRPLLINALDTDCFLTFAQIKKKSLQFAAGLQDICDFKKGDVLAIYSPNQYNYSIPFYGTIAASGITTTVNCDYNPEELHSQLYETKAKVLICHQDNLETALIAGLRAGIEKKNIFIFGDQVIQGIQPFQNTLINEREAVLEELTHKQAKERVAILCFSSGTSSKSKGVMTTHANITANISQYVAFDRDILDGSKDRIIGVLPFYQTFGILVSLNCTFFLGVPLYVLPRFDIVNFCATIQNHKITFATMTPPICLLLAKNDIVSKYDLSTLKFATCGAAPLSAELGRETMTRLPHLIIRQVYGLTETSPLSFIEPAECTKDGSVGILFPNMMAKIIDDEGNEISNNHGERGELCLKGPNIMKGYLNNPEATAECIDKDGFLHTGDIVLTDEEERFYIVDRKKELIKYMGFQVPPAEIEGILLTNPIIADCAVIGVYDPSQATEIPRAYITLKDHATASDQIAKYIIQYVAEKVVAHKHVRSIRFVLTIPKTPSGKILRRLLRESAKLEYTENQDNYII